jgi:hypothetical protein
MFPGTQAGTAPGGSDEIGCRRCRSLRCCHRAYQSMSQTKSEKCAAYVREAARQTPATTRPARGAVRGAIGGAIVGGDIGRGAAAGAIVGGTRSAVMNSGFGHEPPR